MNPLSTFFSSLGISGAELEEIVSAFTSKEIKKGDYFVEEGKISKYLGFVTKGLFQYFYIKDGKEITTYVSGANAFLLSVTSFYKQKPSLEYIRALSDAELQVLTFNDLNTLKNGNNAFRSFYINALENLVTGIDESRTNLIILTAEERYALLLKNEPALLQQFPLQYLASILGVTPRHLSRLRNM